MFIPKKTIPSLAVSMLALTGCGPDNGANLAQSIQAWCVKAVDCFGGYTVEQCVDEYTSYLAEYYNLTPACEAAAASYFSCGAGLSCEELDQYNNNCDNEFEALFDVCEPAAM